MKRLTLLLLVLIFTLSAQTEKRQPWIEAHASELDKDGNKELSLQEILTEATLSFKAYDRNKDQKISPQESKTQVRSTMGGFIHQHFEKLDRDNDGYLFLKELLDNSKRMFSKVAGNSQTIAVPKGASKPLDMHEGNAKPAKRKGGDKKRPRVELTPAEKEADRSLTESYEKRTPKILKSTLKNKPNIVLVLIDDMGWKDMGFMGDKYFITPHTDALAKNGVVFSNAYAAAPNCAPTRACLLTGQYQPRHGVYTVSDGRRIENRHKLIQAQSNSVLPKSSVTIAEVLKESGYATACFGMWNLGKSKGDYSPQAQGFDSYTGLRELGFHGSGYFPIEDPKGRKAAPEGSYSTDALTQKATQFIDENKATPFFLYLPYHAVHTPYEAKEELRDLYKKKNATKANHNPEYGGLITALDQNIGRITAKLKQHDLLRKTYIFFVSDNGGDTECNGLRGKKGSLYEGGIRVPMMIYGPGIKAQKSAIKTPVNSIDILPTIMAITGIQKAKDHLIDGVSLQPLLQGVPLKARDLYYHFPMYISKTSPCSAILRGDYKLIEFFEDGHLELYNLKNDLGEQYNLADSEPEIAKQMHSSLKLWQRSTNAAIPTGKNPNYDAKENSQKDGKKKKSNKKRKGGF